MSLEYICKYYKVAATLGRIVKVKSFGSTGCIIGARFGYVKVKMIGRGRSVRIFHPDDLEYLEEAEEA